MNQIFSPFLREFLTLRFGNLDRKEVKATCHDCFCSKSERGDLPYYRPDLKCCTFHPFLPNYVVGGILESTHISAEVKDVLRKKIKDREYALPLGIFVPVNYQVAFIHREEQDFGNREEFLCPYFDHKNKNCGIWEHRGSVCTSYFCVSDRGKNGLKFWEILGEYLHRCEMVLAQDCLVSMGLPHENIDDQLEYINCESGTPEELASSSMSLPLFQSHWKDWTGNVEQYYQACNDYVRRLKGRDLELLLLEETSELEVELKKIRRTRVEASKRNVD